eukprot:s5038_g3.t1
MSLVKEFLTYTPENQMNGPKELTRDLAWLENIDQPCHLETLPVLHLFIMGLEAVCLSVDLSVEIVLCTSRLDNHVDSVWR